MRDEDYSVFITDFSSFSFDFVFLGRAIIYFVPDYMQFKSGMNQYRKLDLSFEDAFGPLCTEHLSVMKELKIISSNNLKPQSIYKKRMQKFFFNSKENKAEALYNQLINQKENS